MPIHVNATAGDPHRVARIVFRNEPTAQATTPPLQNEPTAPPTLAFYKTNPPMCPDRKRPNEPTNPSRLCVFAAASVRPQRVFHAPESTAGDLAKGRPRENYQTNPPILTSLRSS